MPKLACEEHIFGNFYWKGAPHVLAVPSHDKLGSATQARPAVGASSLRTSVGEGAEQGQLGVHC